MMSFLEEPTGSIEVLESVDSLERCQKDRGEDCVLEDKGVVRTEIPPRRVLNRTVELRNSPVLSDQRRRLGSSLDVSGAEGFPEEDARTKLQSGGLEKDDEVHLMPTADIYGTYRWCHI